VFQVDVDSLLSQSNELIFITKEYNNDYAKDIFNTVQRLLIDGSKIILNQGTNEEINELVMKETEKIINLLTSIKIEEGQFKPFITRQKHFFNEKWFSEVAKSIQISNDVCVFINELNGGDIGLEIKNSLRNPNEKEIHLYGIDRDIDCGSESRQKDIETARGGIAEVSHYWADISFCANHYVSFGSGLNEHSNSEFYKFYRERLIRSKGIFIFNYPYYRVRDIKNILNNNELIAAINTNDLLGNVVFVMKYGVKNPITKMEIQKIEFQSNEKTSSLSNVIHYDTEGIEVVKTFRGNYTDMDDIKVEFKKHEDSSQFIFDYFKPVSKFQQIANPLIEAKPGQIPMLAATEIINGRYVDEILTKKVGRKYGFDHLFSTKIIKSEFQEKEIKIDKNGNKIVEESEKKSNVITSLALTAKGEYIELFSNEMVNEIEDEEKED
jgi:hypothetical protein